jgi:hypothetical protein
VFLFAVPAAGEKDSFPRFLVPISGRGEGSQGEKGFAEGMKLRCGGKPPVATDLDACMEFEDFDVSLDSLPPQPLRVFGKSRQRQPAKVTPFAGGNEADGLKKAPRRLFSKY